MNKNIENQPINKMNESKTITTLYEQFKNSPKKLKIICDWDEVIQATEPYSLWLTVKEKSRKNNRTYCVPFTDFFERFWHRSENDWWEMDYSSHGSDLKMLTEKESWKKYEIHSNMFCSDLENPTDSYQQAPFLTIAEDLMKLIKEDKVEKLIFLSTGDERKYEVFGETFGKFCRGHGLKRICDLRLMSEEIKTQPVDKPVRTKCDWIKYNAKDFDIFIDDNPNICKSVIESNNHFLVKPLSKDEYDCNCSLLSCYWKETW